jgi:hypothetical protein
MPPNAPGCRPKENFYETPVDAYHGVGRRDAMITDEDRQALAYFRAHPRGIRADNLSPAQRAHFDDLLARFVERARPGLVGYEMDRINAADGTGELHFAWAGGTTIDQPQYFRIQGPATLIEFDNAEDEANHVHSVWRDPTNDRAGGRQVEGGPPRLPRSPPLDPLPAVSIEPLALGHGQHCTAATSAATAGATSSTRSTRCSGTDSSMTTGSCTSRCGACASKHPTAGGNIGRRRRAELIAQDLDLRLAMRLLRFGAHGGGSAHREKLFGRDAETCGMYRWLRGDGLPEGFQVLCLSCKDSKGHGRTVHARAYRQQEAPLCL